MNIQPIVEGHGDVEAFPVLLRRLVAEAGGLTVGIGRPIRRRRHELVRESDVQKAVRLALLQQNCGAILILFDGDTDCPAELGPEVRAWALASAGKIPCEVVIAHREYEAWFLAAIESLRGIRGIRSDAESHPSPEDPIGAKEQLEARMQAGRSYMERTDQPALSARFSMQDAYRGSRSFRKLTGSLGAMLRSLHQDLEAWPPSSWTRRV